MKMHQGDNFAISNECAIAMMAATRDGTADLIVTDPPYAVISGGNGIGKQGNRPTGVLEKNDGKMFLHNDLMPEDYMSELYRILRTGCQAYVFTNVKNLEAMLTAARRAGFGLHNLLIWKKNNVTPNKWYMKTCEYILFLYKPPAKTISAPGSKNVLKFNNAKSPKRHPTEKPVDMMEHIICNSSKEGDYVFDPFMGAGSTGVAALKNGRFFFGIEIDKEYYDIALDRLREVFLEKGVK